MYLLMPIVAYRFRAYADEQTLGALKAQLKLACEIYNTLRWADICFYHRDKKGLTQTELRQLALELRKNDKEYQTLHSQVIQAIADRFYEAKQRFLEKKARFPREKKPHKYYSLTYPQSGWTILNMREIRTKSKKHKKKLTLKLSHLGTFKIIMERDLPPLNKVKRVVVKLMKSEHIYISFIADIDEIKQEAPKTGKAVGIDVGIEKLLTTSDGEYLPNLRPYERALKKVRHLHRELSRKKFLSKNWFKAKRRLARAYEHLANLRRDLYMKVGEYLAMKYDVVVMEDIDVEKLVGKSYRKLRMRLYDAAFGELKRIIKYQVEKYGKRFVLVDPANSSRECARCGFIVEDLKLDDRVFVCPVCGWVVDRDFNAALNVLRRAGWEAPLQPVELRPLPLVVGWGQGGAAKQETSPFRAK
jgi:putative transposase